MAELLRVLQILGKLKVHFVTKNCAEGFLTAAQYCSTEKYQYFNFPTVSPFIR